MDNFNIGDKVCIRRELPFIGMVGTVTNIVTNVRNPYVCVTHGVKGNRVYTLDKVMHCCNTIEDGQLVLTGEVPANLMRTTCYA